MATFSQHAAEAGKLHKVECPQCNGYGFVELLEDDYPVQHACYHCGTEGYFLLNDQEYVEFVNEQLREAAAQDARKADRGLDDGYPAFDDDIFTESQLFPWIDDEPYYE